MSENLARFDKDGIELIINTVTGESFASIRGYARMTGKAESTIRSRLKGAREEELKMAEIQTASGIQSATLIPSFLVLTFLAQDKPEIITPYINLVKKVSGVDLAIPEIPAKKKKHNRKTNGYIYLFASEQILKLGFSVDPKQRLRQLQRWEGEMEIAKTIKGTESYEKRLHCLLHQTGEFFGCEWYPVYRKHEILNLMAALDCAKNKSQAFPWEKISELTNN